jgi:hypothetical protein
VTVATSHALAGLAERLTNGEDRERYMAILLYLQALPPEDEFRHLAEMMGLLSLLGQRLPDALAESMTQMRSLTDKAGEYYGEIDNRLEALPGQITMAVDINRIATEMGELFRQQIAASTLESSAAQLRNSLAEITALSGQITTSVKLATLEYKAVADSISAGVSKLTAAAAQLENHHVQPGALAQSSAWLLHGLLLLVTLLVGVVAGMSWERLVR